MVYHTLLRQENPKKKPTAVPFSLPDESQPFIGATRQWATSIYATQQSKVYQEPQSEFSDWFYW